MTKEELIDKIKQALPQNDREFQEIIAVIIEGGFMTELEIARVAGCSRPTVARWKSGANSPFQSMRPPLLRAIIEKLKEIT